MVDNAPNHLHTTTQSTNPVTYNMSSDPTNPISPTAFALAIHDLPLDTLHSKAAEITNSIMHLRHSNEQMLPFAEEGDNECREAMFENLQVIARMNERIGLLKAEVEGRGMMWPGVGGEGGGVDGEGEGKGLTNGEVDGAEDTVMRNGTASVNTAITGEIPAPRASSGRLTDEELRRQLEAQMEDGDDDGVHL
ncbi:hypothetical protein BAUCODRAFT_567208 [Baudoinia panamericana UAMH 10762]|uniref:Uncharacterized protein n=1 Tax=Baudoinia panamericana (strain UAMH 10762) TaxID=717646 RepID=M2NAK8_BAUPA|nr:uncharacterized protein BAUCODRAFT_567208 [Baudoinia panamericana UAMH 10762]EMD01264.1 hypothetical protein BAUCODRAFT_567208 [Baudoinia panamericana UAMH 10762]